MSTILLEDSFDILLEDGTSELLQEDGAADPVAQSPVVVATFAPASVVRSMNA